MFKLLHIFSQFWLKKARSFQSPWDEEKEPSNDTTGNSEYCKLFFPITLSTEKLFFNGHYMNQSVKQTLEYVPKFEVFRIPLGCAGQLLEPLKSRTSGSSSFQNGAGSEYFTPERWKHQKSYKETFPFWEINHGFQSRRHLNIFTLVSTTLSIF